MLYLLKTLKIVTNTIIYAITGKKSKEEELCLRSVAAFHPVLVLALTAWGQTLTSPSEISRCFPEFLPGRLVISIAFSAASEVTQILPALSNLGHKLITFILWLFGDVMILLLSWLSFCTFSFSTCSISFQYVIYFFLSLVQKFHAGLLYNLEVGRERKECWTEDQRRLRENIMRFNCDLLN